MVGTVLVPTGVKQRLQRYLEKQKTLGVVVVVVLVQLSLRNNHKQKEAEQQRNNKQSRGLKVIN